MAKLQAVLPCKAIERDDQGRATVVQIWDGLGVPQLPAQISLPVFVRVLGEPGEYTLQYRPVPIDGAERDFLEVPFEIETGQPGHAVALRVTFTTEQLGRWHIEVRLGEESLRVPFVVHDKRDGGGPVH